MPRSSPLSSLNLDGLQPYKLVESKIWHAIRKRLSASVALKAVPIDALVKAPTTLTELALPVDTFFSTGAIREHCDEFVLA